MKFLKKVLSKERKLLNQIKKDKTKFGEIYEYLIKDIFRYTYTITNNRHDAEDITSQTFLEFYKKIEDFEWRNVSPKFWLLRTARNLSLNKIKKTQFENLDSYEICDEEEISFVDTIMSKDLINRVEKELKTLDSLEQEVVNLRIWENLSFAEIADLQDITENAAKKRFYRVIAKLRSRFELSNLKSLIILPNLFTALMLVSTNKSYSAPLSISSVKGFSNLNIKTNNFFNINMSNLNKSYIFGSAALIISITGTFSYVYFSKKSSAKNLELANANEVELNKKNNEITPTKVIFTPTPTPEINNTPIPTPIITIQEEVENNQLPINDIKPEITPESDSVSDLNFIFPAQEGFITQYFNESHPGMDIASNEFENYILASESGVVTYSGFMEGGNGYVVEIKHGNFLTSYAHLEEKILVKVGDNVSKSQKIGIMGVSGYVTGRSTHFEIKKDGVLVDPTLYMKVN